MSTPTPSSAISEEDAQALRTEIADREAGPLYIAVLPASAADEAGGDSGAALAEIARGGRRARHLCRGDR